jgi:hypothetical protein
MSITLLTSANIPQNLRRFFAIFVDFYAQNGLIRIAHLPMKLRKAWGNLRRSMFSSDYRASDHDPAFLVRLAQAGLMGPELA